MAKSKFYVYSTKDLDNPDVICISGLAGVLFEGYYVWFAEALIRMFSLCDVKCGIRLTKNTHTIASGRGFDRQGAFDNALIDFEWHCKSKNKNSKSLWKDQWHIPWGSVT